jgi:hypothetical protein
VLDPYEGLEGDFHKIDQAHAAAVLDPHEGFEVGTVLRHGLALAVCWTLMRGWKRSAPSTPECRASCVGPPRGVGSRRSAVGRSGIPRVLDPREGLEVGVDAVQVGAGSACWTPMRGWKMLKERHRRYDSLPVSPP